MKIRSIKDEAYDRLSRGRDQVLEKNRGYGIVCIQLNDLTFAIPLRSYLNHSNGFKTIFRLAGKGKVWGGLDYSKALLVQESDLEKHAFILKDQDEYNKIQANKVKICSAFEKYVNGYLLCVRKGTNLRDRRYKFSTLQYFHKELGV